MSTITRILFLSDLHASTDKQSNATNLIFENNKCIFIEKFLNFVKSLETEIDYIFCAGDLADKADADSFSQIWRHLRDVQRDLNAKKLYCVPGNHDHDSRCINNTTHTPTHNMKFQTPPFPIEDFNKRTHFWAWDWCHDDNDDINVILLNSSSNHGFAQNHKHGSVSKETVNQIDEFLQSTDRSNKLNILLCHHHPQLMEEFFDGDDKERMKGGDLLIKTLAKHSQNSWMILHGHMHHPAISYANSNSTVKNLIFSAGSFSAQLRHELFKNTTNQFYIIEIDHDKTNSSGQISGKFNSYSYNNINGWKPSTVEHLPYAAGFGAQKTPRLLANEIKSQFTASHIPILRDEELDEINNDLAYFTPSDLGNFVKEIAQLDMWGLFDENINNKLVQIGIIND